MKETAENGRSSHQVFCPDCASPLYSVSPGADPALLRLRLGTARQRDRLPPRQECWCRSAPDWLVISGTTERLDRQ